MAIRLPAIRSLVFGALCAAACLAPQTTLAAPPPTPEWAKDLIIYEVSTKGFTSPDGAESGTFRSTAGRLDYLSDLGVNGLWLTGHNLADARHFYGIWTQYATIRPDALDPSLGTAEDFEALVDEAHRHGIRVFLDVITHGVMNGSLLTREHPEWFRGGSWGMTDYDWPGGHEDLDEWWVRTFTDYVVRYGVDGYRLDVAIYRPDLWIRIKENAAQAGHPIVVFLESDIDSGGACDFRQRQTTLSIQTRGLDAANPINRDVPESFRSKFAKPRRYVVRVYYEGGGFSIGASTPDGRLLDSLLAQLFWMDPSTIHRDLAVRVLEDPELGPSNVKLPPTGEARLRLEISGLKPERRISRMTVSSEGFTEEVWVFGSEAEKHAALAGAERLILALEPQVPDLKLFSVQLSSHDDGWEGFPESGNPYVAEGSRCSFGYSCLLAPAIPLFMSGEEFDADYVPLPRHTPDLYGKGAPGKGRWLYGSWLQWEQLARTEKAAMLEDVKRMIAIRKAEKDVLHAAGDERAPHILRLEERSAASVPAPYVVWQGKKAIVVAGNDTAVDVVLSVIVPSALMAGRGKPLITDLWGGGKASLDGDTLSFVVKRDKIAGGGLAVHKLEWQ